MIAGVKTLTRALVKAFNVSAKSVRHTYAITNDIGFTAAQAKK